MSEQSDPALDAFDRLRLREVKAEDDDSFLAEFQSATASLKPEERIKLVVAHTRKSMELLKAVLADPQADKICALHWVYDGQKKVNSVIPLLTSNCLELASLQVRFQYHSEFDFVSSVLEHPSSKLKVLEMPWDRDKGDHPRFFAALGQSQVSALTLLSVDSPEFEQGLCDYLAKNLLVRLKVRMSSKQVPLKMTMSLAGCTHLVELKLSDCKNFQPTALTYLPKSITKLALNYCTFAGGFDWSFLTDSNLQALGFTLVQGVEGAQLGRALAVHLRAKGLDRLRFDSCGFVNETLAAVGVEFGRVKRMNLTDKSLDHASVELISLALQSPNNELRELRLGYIWNRGSSINDHLVPALRHPNCNLAKLDLEVFFPGSDAVAKKEQSKFRNRLALFVLLQGQQVRKLRSPLRRLPVEMFRMVGMVLI